MSGRQITWIDLPHAADDRGVLTAIEAGRDVPFQIRRVFFLHDVRGARGGHAHRATRQLLVPVTGSFSVEASDGAESVTYQLNDPDRALYLPPMIWARLTDFTPGAVCLVLADTPYADSRYIREWDEFVMLCQSARETR